MGNVVQTADPPRAGARVGDLIGIFLLCGAILAFEIAFHKIVNVQHYGSLGYVVIGTALFGFAIAGVLLSVSPRFRAVPSERLVPVCAIACGLTMAVSYLVAAFVPLDFTQFFLRPVNTIVALAVCYLGLTLPFFFGGLAIASLLGRAERGVSALYAADLIGAGLGAAVVLPMMGVVGAPYVVWNAAAVGLLAAAAFSVRRGIGPVVAPIALALVVALVGWWVTARLDVPIHTAKREYLSDQEAGRLIARQWSALTRIDVADRGEYGMIWYDGGSMQSHMFHNGGRLENLPGHITESSGTLAYRLRPRKNTLILASAGGREVIWALSQGAERVTAVELDPSVCKLVSGKLNDYLGGLFARPDVSLVNSEGRSFVRQTRETFDVIQIVSAYSVTMVSMGAAASMDSYLATAEAIMEYLKVLRDDGVLMISREHGVKLLATAIEALERLGLDPAQHIYMEHSVETYNYNSIFIRKTPFPPEEGKIIADWVRASGAQVFHAPPAVANALGDGGRSNPEFNSTRALLGSLIAMPPAERSLRLASLKYHTDIATDDKPFFNRINHYMQRLPQGASEPAEINKIADTQRAFGPVPIGDLVPAVVLLEAAVLASIVIFLPLVKIRPSAGRRFNRGTVLAYFSLLGIGFIALEITLLQRYILFVGDPMIAMAVVLGGLLVAAGLGSAVLSPVLARVNSSAYAVFGAIVVASIVYAFYLEDLFNATLHLGLTGRIVVGVLALVPLGLLLGCPFPAGLRHVHRQDERLVGWAWALNGYMTVIGTTAMSIIIPFVGYSLMFTAGGALYLLAGICYLAIAGVGQAPSTRTGPDAATMVASRS